MQGRHNLVAQGRGLHIQVEGLSPAQKHHSAAEGILQACLAEVEDGAGLHGAPVVLEADGYSGPWTWGAPEKWEEGDLSGRETAGGPAAVGVVAWSWGTGQRVAC